MVQAQQLDLADGMLTPLLLRIYLLLADTFRVPSDCITDAAILASVR